MNPHQKNKIDINSLSADEQRLFRLYGKLPNKKDLLQNKLKERKYFDSGDYALSKAGKAGDTGVTTIGTEHPRADDIPHSMHPLTNTLSRTDSISGASPPSISPSLAMGEGGQSMLPNGPSPAGMHRGSINGIPGGGLPGAQNMSRSPIKEQSHLAKSASADDGVSSMDQQIHEAQQNVSAEMKEDENEENDENEETDDMRDDIVSPPPKIEGIPIRR